MAIINKATTFIFLSLLFFSLVFLSLASDGRRIHPADLDDAVENQPDAEAENPYHFGRRSYRTLFESPEGFARVLPPFTERLRWLFRGLRNHRFGYMEMAPHTLAVPHHSDADFIFVILRGRAVITFVSQDTKESFHIERGYVVRVPAGITHYITNNDPNRRLRIAKFIIPVGVPGRIEKYFIAGSQYQRSYLHTFSNEVLTASYNVTEELLERFFQGQLEGQKVFRRVSPEQVRELSRHAITPKDKRGVRRWVPFDLHGQDPIFSNEFGQFRQACPEKFEQLNEINIFVTCLNMTEGSIFVPHYNTEAMVVVFVESGCARFEMACPHISMQQWQQRHQYEWEEGGPEGEEEMSGEVHRIVSHVCQDDAFVIMAGHPVALTAIDQNFRAVGFGVNARYNQINFLAGKENVPKKLEEEAKGLTLGVEEEVAEKVFNSQRKSHFVSAKRGQRRREGRSSFQSILDPVGTKILLK